MDHKLCKCCGENLHQDDFPAHGMFDHSAAIIARYGEMICTNCADDHVTCYTSGVAIHRDEAFRDSDGEYLATEDLALDSDAEWALDAAHIRQESRADLYI